VSGAVATGPRSATLRGVLAEAARDPAAARASLELALRRSGGPLVERLADEPGRALVAFVVTERPDRPRVLSQLFPGYEASTPMQALPGLERTWWAEATAPPAAATVYEFATGEAPVLDAAGHGDADEIRRYVRAHYEAAFADPWNGERCYPLNALGLHGADAPPPPWEKWTCVVRLPGAPPFRWHDEPARRGRVETFRIGSRLLGNERAVSVWTPTGRQAEPLPLVVLLDGEAFVLAMDAPRIFDNLVAGGAAPPFVAASVHNATPASRLGEYGCNSAFVRFLAEELVPELRRRYPLRADARATTLAGYSLGGLAACFGAHSRPDLFGNAAAFSPSLWWGADEPEWLTRRYAEGAGDGLRVWVEVGTLESAPLPVGGGGLSMLSVARRFRDVLDRRGMLAGYRERPGGHDCVNWRQGLPDALSSLLGAGG
jgi:enterochelin esterase family protein